jgi:plasmid stabilization system protein ParE
MKLKVLREAQLDLDEAYTWYEYQYSGLGQRFLSELDITVNRIIAFPEACKIVIKNTRRCLLKSFPFAIFYVFEKEEIIITAIAHLHRNPISYLR